MSQIATKCRHCGREFTYYPASQPGYYCSYACHNDARRESLKTRFWKHVQKTEGCWEWTGCLYRGYGRMRLNDKKRSRVMVHRFSWELHRGPIPDGLFVLHHCDNRCCINPDHLFLGTYSDNTRDCFTKGRNANNLPVAPRGEAHPMSKLTEQQVLAIRQEYAEGVQRKNIAAKHGIIPSYVNAIVRRDVWTHI